MAEWTQVLSAAIRSELEKVADPGGPLVEIEFWRARSAALSSLHEQLQLPNVRKMLQGARGGDGTASCGPLPCPQPPGSRSGCAVQRAAVRRAA